jgi:DNA repair exonuclease SbcCD ATPase subunit
VLVLFLTLVAVANRQQILDFVHVNSYKPTSEMTAITKRASLNETGKFIFYATRPEIENSQEFNESCQRQEQGTAVLGCYQSDRIYVYNVTDPRLDGIREVTAAHEMLHAVYQRMSGDERKQVNALVEVEYEKLRNNPDFADRMAFYDRTEPGERDNELHSIIGTEVADISPQLQAHYAKYFTDRSKVLELFNGYNSVFEEIEQQAKALSTQLDALSIKIDTEMSRYNDAVKALNDKIGDFNKRATGGGFSSQAAFNTERRLLEQQVDAIAVQRAAVDADVKRYEELRVQYNDTVTTSNNLYKSIDSTLAPAPSV